MLCNRSRNRGRRKPDHGSRCTFPGGYGWKKCPLTKVRAQFSELVEEKRYGLARETLAFACPSET